MKKIIYAIVLIALLIAGYYLYIYWGLGNDSVAQTMVGENLEGEADPTRMTLTMTDWRWQKALFNDGREVKPDKLGSFVLKFRNDGTFSAATDCNSAGGIYSTDGRSISFTDIYATEMYCEGSQEAEFIQLLINTSSYHFTSRGELILDLKFDSGSVVFR